MIARSILCKTLIKIKDVFWHKQINGGKEND